MATLQEILAAKKAGQKPSAEVMETKTEPVKEEVKVEAPVAEVPKPLTFQEKMALKKQEEKNATTSSSASPVIAKPVSIAEPKQESPSIVVSEADKVEANKAALPTTEQPEVSDQDKQAYVDIKSRIDTLNSLSGEPLESAMSELKKALMKNPQACSLLEDTDIGQLVIALRKITGEAIAEAAKDGRKTKVKAKQVDLSNPEEVAAVLAEL